MAIRAQLDFVFLSLIVLARSGVPRKLQPDRPTISKPNGACRGLEGHAARHVRLLGAGDPDRPGDRMVACQGLGGAEGGGAGRRRSRSTTASTSNGSPSVSMPARGCTGQGRRHAVHDLSRQAPRRLLLVRLEADQLQEHGRSPPGSTTPKEVADACHALGVELIVYYSQPDGTIRYRGHACRYIQYSTADREILTNYGRIDGLWFDSAANRRLGLGNLFRMAGDSSPAS